MTDPRRIADILLGGGVAVLPTDTVYGLAASPTQPLAVARVFALKRRPATRDLPVMVASRSQIEALGARIPPAAELLLRSGLAPGPLTLVLPLASPPAWLEGREEVAVRIPDHALMLEVLALAGPLLVTSANTHGTPTERSLAEVLAQLDGAPDVSVDGGMLGEIPSTLVNCRAHPPVIEREGAIAAVRIWEILS